MLLAIFKLLQSSKLIAAFWKFFSDHDNTY